MNQASDGVLRRGTVSKCPSCGAQLGAFVSACSACGHEFADVQANRSITSLVERFDEIERDVDAKQLRGRQREQALIERKARVIRDFPIPNSREDLQQLLYFIQPKLAPSVKPDPNIEDWRAKFAEVIARARNAYKGDSEALAEFDAIEASLQTTVATELKIKAKRNPLFVILLVGLVVLGVAWAVSQQRERAALQACADEFTRASQAERSRLEALQAQASEKLKARDFDGANAAAGRLRWEAAESSCKAAEGQKARAEWDDKRNQLLALVQQARDAARLEAEDAAARELAARQADEQRIAEKARAEAAVEQKKAAAAATENRKSTTDKAW